MINKFKNKKRKIILSVGSLHDQKNYFQLLRCFKLFSLKNEYWTYNILGEGELREEIKKYIKSLGLQKKVKVFNFTDPYPFYKKRLQSLFMEQNMKELPMFYSRPCHLRLPIISSDYDGSSDIIKNNYNGIIYKN